MTYANAIKRLNGTNAIITSDNTNGICGTVFAQLLGYEIRLSVQGGNVIIVTGAHESHEIAMDVVYYDNLGQAIYAIKYKNSDAPAVFA